MSDNESKEASVEVKSDFTSAIEQNKNPESTRPEISGTAIARMMGVATSIELKLLEGKLDLISGRINHIAVKVDKVISQFQSLPTGSDLERIDVQIGAVKTILRDLTTMISGEPLKNTKKSVAANETKAAVTEAKKETEIVTPTEAAPAE